MYIAMNRFKVAKGNEAEFEQVWRTRERQLNELEGFVDFHLLLQTEGWYDGLAAEVRRSLNR